MAAGKSLPRTGRGSNGRGLVGVRRGGASVADLQRSRMLRSAVRVVAEHGYGQMTVARVAGGARVSRRTFYDLFEDREDCFLAVFEEAVAHVRGLMGEAYRDGEGWREKVRAALSVLLCFLDEEPQAGSLLVVDALRAGPRVLRRRAELLEQASVLLQLGAKQASPKCDVPPLTGEGVVGAVLGVIHTRLSQEPAGSLVGLLNPLMGIVMLPYRGPAAAQRELERPMPNVSGVLGSSREPGPVGDPLAGLEMRVTYRTLRVLSVIGECPGASNREIADGAGVSDQGQISKLLTRLERLGLIANTGEGQPKGEPNSWRLTVRGEEAQLQIVPGEAQYGSRGRVGETRPAPNAATGVAWALNETRRS